VNRRAAPAEHSPARDSSAAQTPKEATLSDLVTDAPVRGDDAPVLSRLSTLDRFLPVWILAAMAAGLLLGPSQ